MFKTNVFMPSVSYGAPAGAPAGAGGRLPGAGGRLPGAGSSGSSTPSSTNKPAAAASSSAKLFTEKELLELATAFKIMGSREYDLAVRTRFLDPAARSHTSFPVVNSTGSALGKTKARQTLSTWSKTQIADKKIKTEDAIKTANAKLVALKSRKGVSAATGTALDNLAVAARKLGAHEHLRLYSGKPSYRVVELIFADALQPASDGRGVGLLTTRDSLDEEKAKGILRDYLRLDPFSKWQPSKNFDSWWEKSDLKDTLNNAERQFSAQGRKINDRGNFRQVLRMALDNDFIDSLKPLRTGLDSMQTADKAAYAAAFNAAKSAVLQANAAPAPVKPPAILTAAGTEAAAAAAGAAGAASIDVIPGAPAPAPAQASEAEAAGLGVKPAAPPQTADVQNAEGQPGPESEAAPAPGEKMTVSDTSGGAVAPEESFFQKNKSAIYAVGAIAAALGFAKYKRLI